MNLCVTLAREFQEIIILMDNILGVMIIFMRTGS